MEINRQCLSASRYFEIPNVLDIEEKQKENEMSLGKVLMLDNSVYSEIDQLVAEYIEPLHRRFQAMMKHPKYESKSVQEMKDFVQRQSEMQRRTIVRE